MAVGPAIPSVLDDLYGGVTNLAELIFFFLDYPTPFLEMINVRGMRPIIQG